MLERLRRAISLESHDLVTTVVRRGRSDLDLASLAEPVELLCRDLDGPAELHAAGRREARRFVLDRLTRSPAAVPEPTPRRSVVIAGLPGCGADGLAARLGLAPADPAATLERSFRTLDLEHRWHLPGYAEWFDGADHVAAWARIAATAPAGPAAWTSWTVLERLGELERTPGGLAAVVLVDEGDADRRRQRVATLVDDVVAERRRWSDAVDPEAVARYWSWRVDRLLERRDAWAASTSVPVLRLDGERLVTDPDAATAEARELIAGAD